MNIDREKKIPIVFATDINYAPYVGVTISSLIENASNKYYYDIYVFHTELSQDYIKLFEKIKGENFSVKCIDINIYLDNDINLYENFHFSKAMYYRILIPSILSNYSKVIYLDSDMIVLGDISELFNNDLDGFILGGVNDIMHSTSKNYVAEKIKLNPNRYINSGMLLINCDEFKRLRIKEKCFEILKESKIKFRYPDQDIINIACNGKIKFLDPSWNYIWHYNFPRYNQSSDLLLSEKDEIEYIKKSLNINIIHYTSNIKPWNNYNTKYTKYFFDYVRKTPLFKSIIYEKYNSIVMKNYIVLHFFSRLNDKIVLTGAFYTIEDFLYKNSIRVNINGVEHKIKYTLIRNIDIRNLCYVQKFFKIEIESCLLKKDFHMSFYRKERSDESLTVITGKYFPIDKSIDSRLFFDNMTMYIENNKLVIRQFARQEKWKREKAVIRNLLNSKNKTKVKSAFVRIVYYITKPFIKKQIWLISDRLNSAGDNGEMFFRYIIDKNPRNIKPYFVLEKNSSDYKRILKYGHVAKPGTIKFYLLFIHASKNISSHCEKKAYMPFNEQYIKDLNYLRQNIFLQHGVTKDDVSTSYSRFYQNFDKMVVAAQREYNSIALNFNYGLYKENLCLSGFPRYDFLENNAKKIVYVLPTWRKWLFNSIQTNNIAGAKKSEFYKFYCDFLNSDKLQNILNQFDYKLVFVPHEHARFIFKDFVSMNKNIEIETADISYNKIFKDGAVLITDYSSTAFDFAFLHKPIIYCQFDSNTFYQCHTYSRGYFNYIDDGFGKVTNTLDDTLNELQKLLTNDCLMEEIYKVRVDNFFRFHDKQNSKRLFDMITKNDKTEMTLLQKTKLYYKQHGLKFTIVKIFKKLFWRK